MISMPEYSVYMKFKKGYKKVVPHSQEIIFLIGLGMSQKTM